MAAAPADDRDTLLASFMDITNTADVSQARFLLESAGWNLETALGLALEPLETTPAAEGLRRRTTAQLAAAPPPMPQTPPPSAAPAAPQDPQDPQGPWWHAIALLWAPLRWFGVNVVGILLVFLKSLVPGAALGGGAIAAASGESATAFAAQYGSHPTFTPGTFRQAMDVARREFKMLFVILHDPAQPDSERFCRETLGSADLREFADQSLVTWFEHINSAQGKIAARALQIAGAPTFALLMPLPDNQIARVYFHHGFLGAQALTEQLLTVIALSSDTLTQQQQQQQSLRREQSLNRFIHRRLRQSIRDEQDAAYLESLARDEAKAREDAERLAQEQALAAAAERDAQAAAQRVEDRKQALIRKRASLPTSCDGGISLRVQFPDGTRLPVQLDASLPVQVLYDLVDCQEKVGEDFTLLTGHPKHALGDLTLSLATAGLASKSLVFVQDNTT